MFKPLFLAIICLNRVLGIDRSISKKISSGYTLALGTAVLGISCGLLGSYCYAQPARLQAKQMRQQKQLLSDFNNRLLNIQIHPLRLLAIAGESRIWMQYEINQFRSDFQQINRLLEEIEQLAAGSKQANTQLIGFVNEYHATLISYEEFTSNLWESLNGVNNKSSATVTLATALSSSSASELSKAFEQLSEDLTRLQQETNQNYSYATTQLQKVERLRITIILSSMAVSIGLAIALAMMTSRAIARPIENLTMVARQVTQDNNLQLQAPIQTQDEVSFLAKALNQLVSWAGQYTTELEEARQTLEKRVLERTQALQKSEASLRHKADDLQHTLNELQQAQLQLIQSEKMSSLGQLVAGIAHEINNPVSFIHGNLKHATAYVEEMMTLLDLYQNSYPQPNTAIQIAINEIDLPFLQQDFPKVLQSMQEGSNRIRDIVKSLRIFSRLDESAVKEVDLHMGIDSTLTILSSRLKATLDSPSIHVSRNYGQLPPVECYAGQLNQVFMNILSNAIEALELLPPSGNPTITITTQTLDKNWVVIRITDNGPGIPTMIHSRLFDPFFTTKAVGKGTGLGLSISYQIVTKKHHGYLTCDSTPGQGATFTIKLPVKL